MQRPNILLITTDQQRFDALALNGNRILRTPNLDHLAARGVNFTRAYSTCPSCIAARRSLLTGQFPATHGLVGYQDGLEWRPPFTLPGLLKSAGYQTQLVGKLHLYPPRKRYGFDDVILSEQLDYRPQCPWFKENDYAHWLGRQGEPFNPIACGVGPNSHVARPFQLDENLHQTSWCVEQAVEFLTRRRDPSCPWFLHLSFWAPHPPFVPPQVYWDRYAGRQDWRPTIGSWAPPMAERDAVGGNPQGSLGAYPPAVLRDTMAGYYGLINHVDDRLAFLLDRLFEYGSGRDRAPVWILFTTDHGEMLGDHHLFHKMLPYEGCAHIPFFVSGRNVPLAPAASDALVCLEDLLPTICELAGADVPDGVDGRSLAPILTGRADRVRDQLHGEHAGNFANQWLVRGRHKYAWFAKTGEEQLFDLAADPAETTDLSGQAPDVLGECRRLMAAELAGRTDYRYDLSALRPLDNRPPRAIYELPGSM